MPSWPQCTCWSHTLCVCVCVCEAVYVITIFLTKSMSTKAVRTSAMQQKQLVTGLGHKTQEKTTLTKLQCILMTTVVTQTQQTCTKPLSLRSTCLYQTDGSDTATRPHTLPIKLNIYTHHTHVLHFCIPQILLKLLIIYKKMGNVCSLDLVWTPDPTCKEGQFNISYKMQLTRF